MTGVEWVIDARGCDAARLTDQSTLAELFDEAPGYHSDLDLGLAYGVMAEDDEAQS